MKNMIKKLLLASMCISLLALTGCGNAATISSLTDSDSMASTVGTTPSVTPTVNPLIPQSTSESLPAIPAQAVGNTTPTPAVTSAPSVTAVPEETTTTQEPTPAPEEEQTTVTEEETGTDEPEEEEFEPAGEGNTATATSDVNFRAAPTTEEDNIIMEISEGDTVTVISAEDGWYEVEYNGETGYVKADYFE